LVGWGLGVVLALSAVLLATPIVGRPWAWLAGALVLLTPGVASPMTCPSGPLMFAVGTTLATAAWWRAVVADEGRQWFALAGLALGAALAAEPAAVLFVAALLGSGVLLAAQHPPRRRPLLQGAAVTAGLAVALAVLWWLPAAWCRGAEMLAFWDTPHEATEPFGIALIAMAPGVVWTRRLRGLGTLLAVATGYGVLWLLLSRQRPLLLPLVPLLAVATGWVCIELRRFPPLARWAATTALTVAVAVSAAAPGWLARDGLAVALGVESRDDYLLRHEPTWPAAAVANRMLGHNAHLLSEAERTFYFECRVTRESVYRRDTHYEQFVSDPSTLSRQLRCAGFTHLLLVEPRDPPGTPDRPTLSRLADAQQSTLNADLLLTVTAYDYREADGTTRRYRLVMLQ
jgi:hypothetical protein